MRSFTLWRIPVWADVVQLGEALRFLEDIRQCFTPKQGLFASEKNEKSGCNQGYTDCYPFFVIRQMIKSFISRRQ